MSESDKSSNTLVADLLNRREAEQAHPQSGAERLEAGLPVQLFVVGDLPQGSLPDQTEGVVVHQYATLDEALLQVEQSDQNGSETSEVSGDSSSARDDLRPLQVLVLALQTMQEDIQLLLGKAVRGFPHRVIVHCSNQSSEPSSEPIDDAVFFALGFNRLPMNPEASTQPDSSAWFEYRLSQYKAAPDWLNSRFWANPERFDNDEEPDIYCDEEE